MANPVKKKIANGEVSYGVMLTFACPETIEIFGYLGFDFVFIDAEQTPVGVKECTELVRACDVTGIVPIVKVPQNSPSVILGYLETGARGIIGPHVDDEAAARALVDAVKYSPMGKRGASSQSRAARFGLTQPPEQYYRQANDDTLVIALVESEQGIRDMAAISATEGVDVISIGMSDVLLEMGHAGDRNHPEVRKLLKDAYAHVAAAGKGIAAGMKDADAGQARKMIAEGVILLCLSDVAMLEAVSRRFLADMKQ